MGALQALIHDGKRVLAGFGVFAVVMSPIIERVKIFQELLPSFILDMFRLAGEHSKLVLGLSATVFLWAFIKNYKVLLFVSVLVWYAIYHYAHYFI